MQQSLSIATCSKYLKREIGPEESENFLTGLVLLDFLA